NTPTNTPTNIPSATNTPTPSGVVLHGHVLWQGRPAPPDPRWIRPISGILVPSGGGSPYNYSATTDESGYFTVTTSLPSGTYGWRVKNQQTLSNAGNATLDAAAITVEMGTMRDGDADDNNCVTLNDFSILKSTFGR